MSFFPSSTRLAGWCLALPVLSTALAQAQTAPAPSALRDVVVTATRSETRADEAISEVSVITREAIEQSVGRTLSELLARQAGTQTSSNGGLGKTSSVFVRGTENRHVLLLIDGVRYGSSTSGTPNFDALPLELIERIEVLKGPASALYGSDAVGGVVQVFTRKGDQGFHPFASLGVGSQNLAEGTAGFSGGDQQWSYAVGLHGLSSNGFSSTNFRGFSFNPDDDGLAQRSAYASLQWRFAPGWSLDATGLGSSGTSRYDAGAGNFDARNELATHLASLGLRGTLRPDWRVRVQLASSVDQSFNYASSDPGQFHTTLDQASMLHEVDTAWGRVLLGLESLREGVASTTVYSVNSRQTDSVFAGLQGSAGMHRWQLNARQDHNTQFGDANTGSVGYGIRVNPQWTLHAAWGTSFKTPSFNTLYYQSSFFNGNPTTQPETGVNTEVGGTWDLGAHLVRLTYFQNRIKGFITIAPVVANIPYARIQGWTLEAQGAQGDWTYRSALDLLDARNEANGLRLPRRADQQLTLSVERAMGAWSVGANLLAVSDFFDNATNTQPLGGYATLDLSVRRNLNKDWSLQGRLQNVGDKFYQTAYGYNQSGRTALLTLRYQPR